MVELPVLFALRIRVREPRISGRAGSFEQFRAFQIANSQQSALDFAAQDMRNSKQSARLDAREAHAYQPIEFEHSNTRNHSKITTQPSPLRAGIAGHARWRALASPARAADDLSAARTPASAENCNSTRQTNAIRCNSKPSLHCTPVLALLRQFVLVAFLLLVLLPRVSGQRSERQLAPNGRASTRLLICVTVSRCLLPFN